MDDGMSGPVYRHEAREKEAERLWARWHAIRMGAHSLTGKMREDKDVLARLVREEVERAVAEEREAAAKLCERFRESEEHHYTIELGHARAGFAAAIRARSSPAKSGEEEKS